MPTTHRQPALEGLKPSLQRLRAPALACAAAVLLCELISSPWVEMGVDDDWSYVLTAQKLAATGHIVYNGWATAMLGWQLYLAAAFIKLFGPSFTVVRLSTILVAMLTAFLLQRTLVRFGVTERNATLGTLAVVVSPLFLTLSASFMTDIQGLFAILICLYACLRALQTARSGAATAWVVFAAVANVLCGSSRQIAWLGCLVMVPSTLWLLRRDRRLLSVAVPVTLLGFVAIFASMHWFEQQPYSLPEHLLPPSIHPMYIFGEVLHAALDLPFLLLPIMALFLPLALRLRRSALFAFLALSLFYIFITVHSHHQHPNRFLAPHIGDWVDVWGSFEDKIPGPTPIYVTRPVQILFTVLSIGGLFALIGSVLAIQQTATHQTASPLPPETHTYRNTVLLAPFSLAYALLLLPRANLLLVDRYLLPLALIALIVLLRYYQRHVRPAIPMASLALVGLFAVYGISVTHNLYAHLRAILALSDELHQAGIPDTAMDLGFEYSATVELQHAPTINDPRLIVPAGAFVHLPSRPDGMCLPNERFPHVTPRFGIAFDPNACGGPAPFAPVHYARWPASTPGTLYIVRYP